MVSTSSISGLASGLDWSNIIEQLIAVERKKIDVYVGQQSKYKDKLETWRTLNTKLAALKSSAASLKKAETFNAFTTNLTSSTSTDASDLLSASTTSDANTGVYTVVVSNVAEAQKTSSATASSKTSALGHSGEFIINGKVVNVESTDTLTNIRDKINNLNTGSSPTNVTATILTVTEDSDYRLVLTSDELGADGFDLLDASTTDVLQDLGFTNTSTSFKNSVSATVKKTDKFTSSSTAIGSLYGLSSAPSGNVTIGDKTVSINLGTQSLTDIKSAIDTAAPTGVTTSIVTTTEDGVTKYQLQISGTSTYTDANNVLESLGIIEGTLVSSIATGQDASIVVDGTTITRSTNSISDVIDGVTLNLLSESAATTVTLNISRDIDAVKQSIQNMVKTYNDIMKFANEQFTYDTKKKTAGVLSGDVTLTSVQSDLRAIFTEEILGLPSSMNMLSLAGISFDSKGMLNIDDADLTDALKSDFNAVKRLFIYEGAATNSNVEYIAHSADTEAGTYEVYVTTAAARAIATGSGFSGTYTDDASADSITITDTYTGRTATISLNNGDTTSTIVNAINSELDTAYAESLRSATSNSKTTAAGGGYISSTTTWSQINTGGDANNITDNSTISYSGIKRNGVGFSGTYTISDADVDTVGEFLSFIENEFDNEVTASIDSSGRLVLTDNTTGDSQISLTLTENAGSLDFGTLSVITQGRDAIEITATNSGNNLVLTHDEYGGSYGYTVSYSGNNTSQLGITATSYTGTNVAGTINGETATGSGQILTGNDGNTNTDSLKIKVTYSSTVPASLGTVKLTFGASELLERKLDDMLNSVDGYISYKMDGMDTTIDNIQEEIDTLEVRLEKEREKLTNQFLAMEQAISKIQSIGQWLSQQLKSL